MFKTKKINKFLPFIIIFFSSLLISITMFRSGLLYDFGIGFWGPNGHDGVWHLSLINQLKQQVPPLNPIYSGQVLSNYHWGFNLVVAIISNITTINSSILYFQILPILFALLIGFLSYKLAYLITKNNISAIFFVLLNYFAGSFGWVYTLIKNGHIAGESLFWSMQSASTLLNPPFALSLVMLLLGLILWYQHHSSKSIKKIILISLIFSLLITIKVYSGILIVLALSFYWLTKAIYSKKIFTSNFFICLIAGSLSLLFLFILGVFPGEPLIEFKPFWFSRSMIESIDKFYWPKLASFRLNQTNIFISFILEIALILIFFIGNLGTRLLGFVNLISRKIEKKINDFDKLISFIFIFSFLIPLLFVQKGTAWNTIQFFYYFLFFANFYLAQFLAKLYSKKKVLALFLLFLSFLTSYSTLKDYFGNPPPSHLPKAELEALNFLKEQNSGYVLTYPYDKYKKNNLKTPIPLYAYETTSYVSAFSHHQSFLEDEMNLDITGFDWQSRRQESELFFSGQDKFFARGFLINNNINYIYLVDDQSLSLSEDDLQIDLIFSNNQVKIYQVRR